MKKADVDELLYKVKFFNYVPPVDELEGLFKTVQGDIDQLSAQVAEARERMAAYEAALDSLTAEDMQKRAGETPQIFALPKSKDTGKINVPEPRRPVWNWREGRYR